MPDVTIQTTFGEIRFTYNTPEELTAALQVIEQQIGSIQEAAKRISPLPTRLVKTGCEEIYRFLPSGRLELFRFPSEGTKLVVLALFAYHPELVSAVEIEAVTGITGVIDRVLGQTNNKKYFRKSEGSYGLSPEGLKLFTESVFPSLLPTPQTMPEDEAK